MLSEDLRIGEKLISRRAISNFYSIDDDDDDDDYDDYDDDDFDDDDFDDDDDYDDDYDE